jgi:hypothetical protein
MKKYISYMIFTLGLLMVFAATFYALHTSRSQESALTGDDIPQVIAGIKLTRVSRGQEAIASIQDLHQADFPVVAGVVAEYGQKNATLWLAETGSDTQAVNMLQSMESKIAEGGSPFTPMGVFQFQNRDVYMLDGLGQTNFYARSGSKVFWLAIFPQQAEQAVKELLAFYP